jgi:hypothetical protein
VNIKNKSLSLFLAFFLMLELQFIYAQNDTILIQNNSFEVFKVGKEFELEDWFDCGRILFPLETAPDIHPNNGKWAVTMKPKDGSAFIGMVVRDNGSYESMSQRLKKPLLTNHCYTVSVYMARSSHYKSHSHITKLPINYITPVLLEIYGGEDLCNENEILATSKRISNRDWEQYNFTLNPKTQIKSLSLKAWFDHNNFGEEPYCGHLIIDNFSSIVEIDCR